MNNNSKKNIFTKKNIIIGTCVLAIMLLLIYFIFLKEPKEKVMNCTMSIDNYSYANIDMTINAYYTRRVNRVEGKVNFEVSDETLKTKIKDLEQTLINYYNKSIKGDSIEVNVYRENFNIIMDYSIDYDRIQEGDIESFDLFPTTELSNKINISELKEQIVHLGGNCIEE